MRFTDCLSDYLENCCCFYWLFGKPKPVSQPISNALTNHTRDSDGRASAQGHQSLSQPSEQSLLSSASRTHNYDSFERTVCTEQVSSQRQPPDSTRLSSWPKLFQFTRTPSEQPETPVHSEPERAELEATARHSPDTKSYAPPAPASPSRQSSINGLLVLPLDNAAAAPLPISETVIAQQQQTTPAPDSSAFVLEYAHGAFVHYKPQSAATDTAHALCCAPDVQTSSCDDVPAAGTLPKSQSIDLAPAADTLTISSSGLGSVDAGSRAGRDELCPDADSNDSLSLDQSVVLLPPLLVSDLSAATATLSRLSDAPTAFPVLTPMPMPMSTLMLTPATSSREAELTNADLVGSGAHGLAPSSTYTSGNHLVAAHRPAVATRSFPCTSEHAGANGATLGAPHPPVGSSASLTGSRRSLSSRAKGLLESRRGSSASLTICVNAPSASGGDVLSDSKYPSPTRDRELLEGIIRNNLHLLHPHELRSALLNSSQIYAEFLSIPMNYTNQVTVPGAGVKNRYGILPNEHSRVVLPRVEEDPLSTYINANYVRGFFDWHASRGDSAAPESTRAPFASLSCKSLSVPSASAFAFAPSPPVGEENAKSTSDSNSNSISAQEQRLFTRTCVLDSVVPLSNPNLESPGSSPLHSPLTICIPIPDFPPAAVSASAVSTPAHPVSLEARHAQSASAFDLNVLNAPSTSTSTPEHIVRSVRAPPSTLPPPGPGAAPARRLESAELIAAQGPLENTLFDWWRMIWHVRAPLVVCITQLTERGKVKCAPYLPIAIGIECLYGDISVQTLNCTNREGYQVRNVVVKHRLEPGHELHLRHFWFAEWSDQRAPSPPALQTHLLCLLLEVLQLRRPLLLVESVGVGARFASSSLSVSAEERSSVMSVGSPNSGGPASTCSSAPGPGLGPSGPALVHCSAGLGRTGCFIALYKLLCETLLCGGANVARAVAEMRLDRGGLVQTSEQYELIYHTLGDFLDALGAESAQQAMAAGHGATSPLPASPAQLHPSLSDLLTEMEADRPPSFAVGFFAQ